MALNSLPSDILFGIFTLLDDLKDLHNVVSTDRSLHLAFQDHRASILEHVFRSHIIMISDSYRRGLDSSTDTKHDRTSLPVAVVRYVSNILDRVKATPSDHLTLRATAWTLFVGFESSLWIFPSFGKSLIALCKGLDRQDLALSYSVELWKYIVAGQTVRHGTTGDTFNAARDADRFAQDLAEMYYHDFNNPDDAVRIIQERYDKDKQIHDYRLLSNLVRYAKDIVDHNEMLSFFQDHAAMERNYISSHKRNVNVTFHWAFGLIIILCGLDKIQDAVHVFNQAYELFQDDTLSPVSLEGLSRRLIGSLKDQGYHDEAFTIHQQMLTLLSRMVRNTTSQYMGWANNYISELYLQGRLEEALAVEQQCWYRIRERLAMMKDRAMVFTGRNAAWSLYRSYERRGLPEQAMAVRWEYESLAMTCTRAVTFVAWPGEATGAHLSAYKEYRDKIDKDGVLSCATITV